MHDALRHRYLLRSPLTLLLLCTLGGCAPPESTRPSVSDRSIPPGVDASRVCTVVPPTVTRLADAYYIDTCAVCGGRLGVRGEAVEIMFEGRNLRVCCPSCRDRFKDDARACVDRVDAIMIADQLPHYPLKTSIISGEALGEKPLDFILYNRLFRVRGSDERDSVMQDPHIAFERLNEAVIRAQSPTYAMPDKCPVQGDILPSDAIIDMVVANRMIRVCCQRCVNVIRARPSQYLGMVDYANKEARERAHDADQD